MKAVAMISDSHPGVITRRLDIAHLHVGPPSAFRMRMQPWCQGKHIHGSEALNSK